jgi:hypothetical protein
MSKDFPSLASELDELLHPAQAFETPKEVLNDVDLTLNEKRAILASWASDACAVESLPAVRRVPNGRTVTFDDIIEALRKLDAEYAASRVKPEGRLRRLLRKRNDPRIDGGDIGLH